MRLSEFAARLDDRLDVAAYAAADASANGLQIAPAPAAGAAGRDPAVEHAAFAVDAAVGTAREAAAAGADVLVAHHGIVWGGLDRVTGREYARVEPFVDRDLALYVSHLPLDGHPELGNAAGLADRLGLVDREPFGAVGRETIGVRGTLPEPLPAAELAAALGDDLDTGGRPVRTLEFGPDRLAEVAVVTGSGAEFLGEAAAAGVDALLTGEGKGKLYHEARESGVSVLLAGHYATETVGVRRLRDLAGEWGLTTTFVDCPTGL